MRSVVITILCCLASVSPSDQAFARQSDVAKNSATFSKLSKTEQRLFRSMKRAGHHACGMKLWDLKNMAQAFPKYIKPVVAKRPQPQELTYRNLRDVILEAHANVSQRTSAIICRSKELEQKARLARQVDPQSAPRLEERANKLKAYAIRRFFDAYAMSKAIDGLTSDWARGVRKPVNELYALLQKDPTLKREMQQHMERNPEVYRHSRNHQRATRNLTRGRVWEATAYATGMVALAMTAVFTVDPSLMPGLEFAAQPMGPGHAAVSAIMTALGVGGMTALSRGERRFARTELQAAKSFAVFDALETVKSRGIPAAIDGNKLERLKVALMKTERELHGY